MGLRCDTWGRPGTGGLVSTHTHAHPRRAARRRRAAIYGGARAPLAKAPACGGRGAPAEARRRPSTRNVPTATGVSAYEPGIVLVPRRAGRGSAHARRLGGMPNVASWIATMIGRWARSACHAARSSPPSARAPWPRRSGTVCPPFGTKPARQSQPVISSLWGPGAGMTAEARARPRDGSRWRRRSSTPPRRQTDPAQPCGCGSANRSSPIRVSSPSPMRTTRGRMRSASSRGISAQCRSAPETFMASIRRRMPPMRGARRVRTSSRSITAENAPWVGRQPRRTSSALFRFKRAPSTPFTAAVTSLRGAASAVVRAVRVRDQCDVEILVQCSQRRLEDAVLGLETGHDDLARRDAPTARRRAACSRTCCTSSCRAPDRRRRAATQDAAPSPASRVRRRRRRATQLRTNTIGRCDARAHWSSEDSRSISASDPRRPEPTDRTCSPERR